MSEISAKLVQELRQKTGAGMMDCKVALKEANGDLEGAIENLRKKGLKDLGKRAGKVAAEGTIGHYIHHGGQIAAIIELNCETDFVARGEDFTQMARDIAMHVAASNPRYLTAQDVPADVLEKEKEILRSQLSPQQQGMADKIIEGRLKKFYEENCLLNQIFVRDETGKLTIDALLQALSVKTGEKVAVRRYQRFAVGEGIEVAVKSFAEEVAATIGA
jgi:elongation factor Ts